MPKTVLFQIITMSIKTHFQCQKLFYFKPFSLAYIDSLVLFDSWLGPYHVLSLRARVDLGVIALKGYSAYPKVRGWVLFLCRDADGVFYRGKVS